ncbi:Crp/Fnr family transcriptional regulator [Pseudogracilibacillus sp. SO30301A]|uniref:Crp/Fnr family transcriptional regulator n=1 Tax=Pseudogracilibacillus sp. SO30301A TaxID=3098291 RepID=UPI00300E3D50
MRAPKENSQAIKSFLLDVSDYHKTLDKNDSLFEPGDNIQYLYMVTSGKIVLSKPLTDGREFALRICKKGDLIGESTLFSNHGTKHILHATAHRKSSVAGIHKEHITNLLQNNDKLALYLINEISQNALRDQTKLIDLVMHGKKGALYSTLIRLANSYGQQQNGNIFIKIKLTNQELANFCGTSRENINRSLSELRKDRIISIENKHIMIHDIDFLKEELNCEGCPITLCSIH